MNIIRLPLRELWYIFSILDNIINHCHSQCEKYIRCHLFFTKLSGFFSDVIFKIYTPVLFHIIKSPLLITEELSNMTLKKKIQDCSHAYNQLHCESLKKEYYTNESNKNTNNDNASHHKPLCNWISYIDIFSLASTGN